MGAKIAAAPGRGQSHQLGSLQHQPVMRDLISVALIVAREAPDLCLVLDALLGDINCQPRVFPSLARHGPNACAEPAMPRSQDDSSDA